MTRVLTGAEHLVGSVSAKTGALDKRKTTGHIGRMPQRNLREQLVEGAFPVLLSRGYYAASVSDIAEAAGIPKGSVYNHFASKEALALEVVQRYVDGYPFTTLIAPQGSPMARLRTFFEDVAERTLARGVDAGCRLGNFSTEAAGHSDLLRDLIAASFELWSQAVTTVLEEAQKEHELRPELDAVVLGPYLVDAFEGAVARVKLSGDRAALDAFSSVTFDQLLRS